MISAGGQEKLPSSGKLDADIFSWYYDMEGHAKEMCGAILRAGEQKQPSNCTKIQLHALVTINSKKNWDLLENGQTYALHVSGNAWNWHAYHQENIPTPKRWLKFSTAILNHATSIMFPQT